mgnify:CR=1 FL=1
MTPLKLRTSIQEKFASAIRQGQVVRFARRSVSRTATFEGKVAYVVLVRRSGHARFAHRSARRQSERVLAGLLREGQCRAQHRRQRDGGGQTTQCPRSRVSTVYVIEDGKARQQIVTLGSHEQALGNRRRLEGHRNAGTSQAEINCATGMPVLTGDDGEGARGERGGRGDGSSGATR